MKCDLTGKRALVTGSSRGIGSAIAYELALGGAEVVIHYAGREDAAIQMKEKIEAIGGKCSIVHADLCDPKAYKKLVSDVGDIDILVLNASVQYKNDWENINEEEFYKWADEKLEARKREELKKEEKQIEMNLTEELVKDVLKQIEDLLKEEAWKIEDKTVKMKQFMKIS